ncbi:MAG TPA: hypothetical protein VN228_20515 [Pyrinomonadaceae bacterium]|nr:hypothetical protein [Pyrinomonadaceae bacterium]
MSKRNGRRAAALVSVACVVAALAAPLAGAEAPQQSRPAIVNPKTAAVREATAEVLVETSAIRKLPVLRQVRSGAQTRAEIEQMLVRNLTQSSSPEELRATELTLKKLGLLPGDFRLRAFLVKLLAEQVAGYYDPKAREFFLADWIDLDAQKPVMAHELTHALQDQHFNLRRFENWPKHDSDAEAAAHALVEGDAMLVMMQYVMRNPARQLAMLKSLVMGGGGSTEVYDKAPRVLRETIVFPYTQGASWAGQVYRRGGWELVSASYAKLPQSTEQILHPEKYFAGEAPQKVQVRDISAALGRGWRMADQDVNGEWAFYLILDEFLQDKAHSQRAAAGWGGDRYALFTGRRPGETVVALKTVWDTPEDAREFFDAYARRTTKRYGTDPSAPESAGRLGWATPEGGVNLELSGRSVVVLEGVPAGAKPGALTKLL